MNNPLVFTDFHHGSLLNSLIMLFEGRMGGKVFRPIGTDWFEQGYWKVYNHPATVNQFLGVGGATPDGTQPLNDIERESDKIGIHGDPVRIYHCKDIEGDRTNKAITLEGFLALPFDIVIASLPDHIEPFKKLCSLHPSRPKLIYQIGNQWIPEQGLALNVLASAKMPPIEGTNFVSYHQEFDLDVFKYFPPLLNSANEIEWPPKQINSFVNVFQNFPDFALFERIEAMMDDFSFGSFGGQCRDGNANGSAELADKMANSRFIWHTKAGGDGYGHVLHNAAAIGRPMIVKKSYYHGKLGEDLMIDGLTCIDIDGLTDTEIVEKIRFYNQPDNYERMCKNVYENFKKVVDFDKEYLAIQRFIDNLI